MSAARLCWEKALALDPASAPLNAMLGFIHSVDARFGWWDDRETALGKAQTYVDKALAIDPGNADAHTASGCVFLIRGRHDEAVAHARKAIELAPGSADVADLACFVLAPSGYPEEAIAQTEKAMALSPNYPAVYLGTLGNAYRTCGANRGSDCRFKAYHARSRIWPHRSADHLSGDRPSGGSQANGRAVAGGTSELHRRHGPTLNSSAVILHGSRPMSPRFAPPAFRWVEPASREG